MRRSIALAAMLAVASHIGIATNVAEAADRLATPEEGMVFQAHAPAVGGCEEMTLLVTIGPGRTVSGIVAKDDFRDVWKVKGTYRPDHHTFHLESHELSGALRTGSVDGQVRQDGSLVLKIGDVSGPSPCADKTIYVPWFRDGNAFDPNGASASGGG